MEMEPIMKVLREMEDMLARKSVESEAMIRSFEERTMARLEGTKDNCSVMPSAGGGNTSSAANLIIPPPRTHSSAKTEIVSL